MRDDTLNDIAVQHVLATRGQGARVDMDTALNRVAEELETFAQKRDRIVNVGATVAFVLFSLFSAHEVSVHVEGSAFVAPVLANAILATAVIAAFVAFAASRKKDHLIDLEKRGKSLATIRDPALAPAREVMKEFLEGAYAVFDRNGSPVDRPVFASPHAVILLLPLQRHRNYRLPNAKRPFDEQLTAARVVQPKSTAASLARSGATARNAFLHDVTSMLCIPRFEAVADRWADPAKGKKLKLALLEARELTGETPSLTDTEVAKRVAAWFSARDMTVGLSGSSSTEWLEQVLGGTGDYGWIRDYLCGNDEALPPRRATKRRS